MSSYRRTRKAFIIEVFLILIYIYTVELVQEGLECRQSSFSVIPDLLLNTLSADWASYEQHASDAFFQFTLEIVYDKTAGN